MEQTTQTQHTSAPADPASAPGAEAAPEPVAGPPAEAGPPAAPDDLAPLGLATGDRVRWRDRRSSRWREGRVLGRERDGSVGVRDGRGASRALLPDRLEVRDRGPRGGVVWEAVPERAARAEQLGLWQPETPTEGRRTNEHRHRCV
ncbi:MAG: hypothetical protein PV358_12900 [Acidimicrobiales bacterium]|nr:hypothetical protein [Acidimicrobiales bacterium]